MQISQVCQLCQQSPRLFTNHAAQLHTLLVSPFTLCFKLFAEFSIGPNKRVLCLAGTLIEEGGGALANEAVCYFFPPGSLLYLSELHG